MTRTRTITLDVADALLARDALREYANTMYAADVTLTAAEALALANHIQASLDNPEAEG